MYKYVNTLTDSKPFIAYFKKHLDTTSPWRPGPSENIVILKEDISDKGVDDPAKVSAIGPVEQTTIQAKASLAKQIEDGNAAKPKKTT
jgi:hypothetical protein